MNPRSLGRLTRNAEAPLLFESFFVAAVGSFLGIRSFLALTDYPRIGSNGIHIAHMLWGGLLMLLALMLLIAFLDRSVHHLAAVIAGLGFGTFIDEIGKFVTADNDYFFRPAVALIYVLFVGAFLVARTLIGQRRLSEDEAYSNALVLLADTPGGPMEPGDRVRINRLLELADPKAASARLVKRSLAERPTAAEHRSLIATVHGRLSSSYERLMANAWAERALVIGVVAYAAVGVVGVALTAVSSSPGSVGETWTVATITRVGSTLVGVAFVGWGVVRLRTSRAIAYQWFMRGLLVWILITQMFDFYSAQLAGLGALVVNLIAYGSLRFALSREIVAGRDVGGPSRRKLPAHAT
ncbi:MAG: hypothetical protein M3067_08620 [Chloroflexota bacterium]|nr:hypothetical protein [Chloroflexota bacterium]